MFKKSYTGIVIGLLFFNVAFAQNSTSTNQDLLNLIQQLQAQIQSLQAQVSDLQAQVQSVKIELKFSRALAQGATGDDVKQLQEFLKTYTGSYPDGLITGYFGPLTEAAVKRFQEQNGIESVGVVGPITQNKLNVLFTAIPATPAVPAPGTVMPATPTSVFAGLSVSLASNNPTAGVLSSSATSASASVPVLAVNLTAGNSSAMTVSELKFHENGWFPDSSISDAYLVENGKVLYRYNSILGGVIDFGGLSFSVAAGQTRTIWLVIDITSSLSVGNMVSFGLNAASDVAAWDTSNNSVAAISGSFPIVGNFFMATSASNLSPASAPPVTTPSAVPATPAQPIGQTSTAAVPTPLPAQLPPTTPTTPVTPCIITYSSTTAGTSCSPNTPPPSTLCVNCSSIVPFTPSVIKVLSPNGGEQWQIGGTYTIKYSAENISSNDALLIYLEKGYDAPTTKTGWNSSLLIGATTNPESFTYTVPQNIQSWPGLGNNYAIEVLGAGSYSAGDAIHYIGDSSDATFGIVAAQDNTPPANSTPATQGTTATSTSGGGYGQLLQDQSLPTSAPTPIPSASVSAPPLPATPTTQDKTAVLLAQISDLQNQLNSTTDTAQRASLAAQIAALQTQVQALQNN